MITGDSNEMKPLNLYTHLALFLLVTIALLLGCSKEEGVENEDFPVVISTRIETDPTTQDTVIAVTFSKEMLPASITTESFIIMQGNTVIPGSVSYYNKRVIFIPAEQLLSGGVEYKGRITTSVKDINGVSLESDYVWTFSTSWSTITATAGENGTITPSGAVKVESGFSKPFTLTPDPGYHVSEILIDGEALADPLPSTYLFKDVKADHTIEVSFVLNSYTVTATAGANGSITPSGEITANHGELLTFTITPDAGFFVSDILVDDEPPTDVESPFNYSLQVTKDYTLDVSFTDRDPSQMQYLVVNIEPSTRASDFNTIASLFQNASSSDVKVGIGFIISYLHSSPSSIMQTLLSCFSLSEQYNIPLIIQPDGEQWWGSRSDLWNWWDPGKPGYNPANKNNVEWTDWSAESAIKIGWRNWGRQLRVDPMPNLMSSAYRTACHTEMEKIITATLNWWQKLPWNKKHLFIGIKIGWESAIGVNNWYYPNGNDYLNQPEANDPTYGLKVDILPGRGVTPIGYAAVKSAGLSDSGDLKESDVATVVQIHLEELCKQASGLGVPRDHIFTHAGGWSKGELLYGAALNAYSCPGWSFYQHATNPVNDVTAMQWIETSDAPNWGAVEWLYLGQNTQSGWKSALDNTLSVPGVKYMNIYNWNDIKNNSNAISAIQQVISENQ